MNRNTNDKFNALPTPSLPRTKHDFDIVNFQTTQGHGLLTPIQVLPVYPGFTWSCDMAAQVLKDTSDKIPLGVIYDDIYWFFVPYRILDKDFPKIFGFREDPLDDDDYYAPQTIFECPTTLASGVNFLPLYLGWSMNEIVQPDPEDPNTYAYDGVCSYALAAYWKIVNEFFLDTNLDTYYNYEELYNPQNPLQNDDPLLRLFRVNKFRDYFTSGLISPIKGPMINIPTANFAPVGFVPDATGTLTSNLNPYTGLSGSSVKEGEFKQMVNGSGSAGVSGLTGNLPIVTDLSNSMGSIQQLVIAMQLYQMQDKKGRFGTRYIELIRGQFGIDVPDMMLDRPEYLGGQQVCLSNIPVLDQTGDNLGSFAGLSKTTFEGSSWSKTFIEYGCIIGLSVTRIKHVYGQGVERGVLDLQDELSFYNPALANTGNVAILNQEIYNNPLAPSINVQTFNFNENYSWLRTKHDRYGGYFAPFLNDSSSVELRTKWNMGDYYDSLPIFSADWLKEPDENVRRTLTGRLIPGSVDEGRHQYMFNYMFKYSLTAILPAHATTAGLLNRL